VGRVSCLCVTLKFTKNIGNCALPPHRSGQDQVCSIINSEQTLSSRQAGSAGLFSVYHVDVCVVVCLLLVIRCTSYHSGLGCVSSFLFLFFSFSCSRVCVFACSLARSLSLSLLWCLRTPKPRLCNEPRPDEEERRLAECPISEPRSTTCPQPQPLVDRCFRSKSLTFSQLRASPYYYHYHRRYCC
jgi:hypothetical protein